MGTLFWDTSEQEGNVATFGPLFAKETFEIKVQRSTVLSRQLAVTAKVQRLN